MSFRCGVFASPTSTGTADFDPGLPGEVTALFLKSSGATSLATVQDASRISFGATDGTTQWVASAGVLNDNVTPVVDANDVMDTSWSTSSIVRVIDHTGSVIAEAEFVSFNADGTVTLDWTTAPATAIYVSFDAWDQSTALTGVNLIDTAVSQTVDVSSAISDLKVVVGANQRDVNDGTVSYGYCSSASTRGNGYAVRVDVSNDFEVTPLDGNPYQFTQAATAGSGSGRFENFTSAPAGFDISIFNSGGPVFTDQPVGWLAIGDGGPWFVEAAPLRNGLSPTQPLNAAHKPLGLIHSMRAELGSNGSEHYTIGYGAWDNTDNQYFVLDYLERDTSGTRNAITGRATYNDRVALQLTNKSTVSGYMVLTDDDFGGPLNTITGTQPQQVGNAGHALYFVHTAITAHPRFWAELV